MSHAGLAAKLHTYFPISKACEYHTKSLLGFLSQADRHLADGRHGDVIQQQ